MSKDEAGIFMQICEYCKQYADDGIINIWFGPVPYTFVFKAQLAEELLNSSKHLQKSFEYRFLKPMLGDGLLLSSGDKWFKRRKMITPTFHFKILEEFMHIFNEQASILVRHLDKMADGPEFNFEPFIYHCMLDVICDAAMGIKIHAQDDTSTPYIRALHRESELFARRTKSPWLFPDFLHNLSPTGRESAACLRVMHEFTKNVIEQRKMMDIAPTSAIQGNPSDPLDIQKSSGKKKRLAFLDMLLEHAKTDPSFTDMDIREEVDTFMFEGHDTTSAGSIWILCMLGCFPEEQQKVQQEIDCILRDDDQELTMDDISKLNYTDCFIKETFRLYPPVPWFLRSTSEARTFGGFDIRKGFNIGVFIPQLHRDPEFFPDPEHFRPDRWLDNGMAGRHPFCYLPFSAGIRNCIGQRFAMLELKTVMCHILRRYNVVCSTKREDIVATALLILKPLKPVLIQLKRRDH
jgi:cytochrome P450 family 4 subfamily V